MALSADHIKRLLALKLPDAAFNEVLAIVDEVSTKRASKATAAKKERGGRLPADWSPDLDYAIGRGLTRQEASREADKFKNYWASQPGQKGIKLDWQATWRNWCISSAERLGRSPVASSPAAAATAAYSGDMWAAIMRAYRRSGSWKPEYGPMPGERGCRVPAEFISDGRQIKIDKDSPATML